MTFTLPKPNRELGVVDALGLLGILGLLVARYVPIARLPFWGCALRETTGWPCPGCGLTRVADRVSHLNFAGAWEANPLGTVFAVLFALLAVVTVLHLAFKLPIPTVSFTPREALVGRLLLVAVVIANYGFIVVKAKFPHLLT